MPSFPDGVWLAELAPLTDPALVVQTVGSVFHLREQLGMPLNELLIDYLREKNLLLILDNCEHLIDTCAQLADQLLHACTDLKMIVSSREALGIAGETIYRVPPLSLPDPERDHAGSAHELRVRTALHRAGLCRKSQVRAHGP